MLGETIFRQIFLYYFTWRFLESILKLRLNTIIILFEETVQLLYSTCYFSGPAYPSIPNMYRPVYPASNSTQMFQGTNAGGAVPMSYVSV